MKRKQVASSNKKRKRQKTTHETSNKENRYLTATPDFKQLAELYPEFATVVVYNKNNEASIDWKDQHSQITLTKTLLHHDYSVEWDLPGDEQFLIPPVTNRVNYIHWIHRLLSSVLPISKGQITGIDVGTGANVIYPLLGRSIHGWSFVGTDINPRALEIAAQNVKRNGWEKYISLVHQSDTAKVLEGVIPEDDRFHFLMCNPPFFTQEELDEKEEDIDQPDTICTGNSFELVTPGGEIEFVKKIVHDSLQRRDKIAIYSSMLGKKASIHPIRQYLYENNIKSVFVTEFVQGKTSRWGIAWTFFDLNAKRNEIIVKPTMRYNIFHFESAGELFTKIEKCVKDHPQIGSLTRTDKFTCQLHGVLTTGDQFSIQIMQRQPKQYIVEMKNMKQQEPSQAFIQLHQLFSDSGIVKNQQN